MQLVDLVEIGKNMVVAVAAASGAGVGIIGLKTWQRSLRGTSEYTRAKELLKAVYRVRNAFDHVRNPAIWQYEYPEDMVDVSGHLKREFQYEGAAHVYEERWKVLAEAFRDLENENLVAEVEWGTDVRSLIIPLRECRIELQLAIQDHLEAKKPGYYGREEEPTSRSSQPFNVLSLIVLVATLPCTLTASTTVAILWRSPKK
jgi:hypothetical protein